MADPIVNLPGEIWKPVVGWEGAYEVSSEGRVRGVVRTVSGPFGDRQWKPRLLRFTQYNGYPFVMLSLRGRRTKVRVHVLVATAFIGPCPVGMECCHGNGIRTDNRVSNLRWDTRSANIQDAIRHGTWQGASKREVSATEISDLCRALPEPEEAREIEAAKKAGVL